MIKLEEYNRKRNFERTGEPEGETAEFEDGLRFVVQHHMARREHYDLRLEWNDVLLSWAVPKGPSYNTHDKRLAVRVEDHPLDYRNFEGTIPKGEYGGGTVMLWDEGYWEPYGDVDHGLREGMLKFVLKGRRLKGNWALVRFEAKEGETKETWLLLKEKDEYTETVDGISEFTASIRTGRTMTEIAEGVDKKVTKNPFGVANVQLAKLVNTIPKGEDWFYELKYDGYRVIAFIEGNNVRLITRNGKDFTARFQNVAASLMDWAAGRALVLDGEMTVTDASGKTDFQALQNYMRNPKGQNLTYIVFDLLALDGIDLRNRRLTDRKEMLEGMMKDAPKNLWYSRHVRGSGQESFAAACEMGMEGIVGKKVGSVYSGTRNGDWIKLKCDTRQEFVIGGYTLSDKRRSGISSLFLGVYEGNDLIYAGRAGTGLSESGMKELEEKFKAITKKASPFKLPPKSKPNEKVTWLAPKLVAEIKFAEWTEDNLLRQASFKGLRTDKNPKDVKREKADDEPQLKASIVEMEKAMETTEKDLIIEGIKITHPDKVLFEDSQTNKADVIRYYEKVAERMLPYVSHRILSIVRCPKGISQTCFYKKHPGQSSKGIITIPVPASDGAIEDYFYIADVLGLISEAQMGRWNFTPGAAG